MIWFVEIIKTYLYQNQLLSGPSGKSFLVTFGSIKSMKYIFDELKRLIIWLITATVSTGFWPIATSAASTNTEIPLRGTSWWDIKYNVHIIRLILCKILVKLVL